MVSVIVAAHNEEAAIAAKIRNVLASDYPRERLEILIGSDGSSDRTEEIVRGHADDGVGLISFPQQMGKSAIQNGLVAAASGEILVFSDADCEFDAEALRMLVRNFADEEVGLVTAAPRYVNEGETAVTRNESAYLRYESWIREEESRRGMLAMASGSLFALRRRLWRPLHCDLGDDFELPLRVAEGGMRNVLERGAATVTRLSQVDAAAMFRLKVRIVSKDFRALREYRALLNPFAYGATAAGIVVAQTFALVGSLFSAGDAREQRVFGRAILSRDLFAAGGVLCGGAAGIFVARAGASIFLVCTGVVLGSESGRFGRRMEVPHRAQFGAMDAGARAIDLVSC